MKLLLMGLSLTASLETLIFRYVKGFDTLNNTSDIPRQKVKERNHIEVICKDFSVNIVFNCCIFRQALFSDSGAGFAGPDRFL